MRIRTYALVAVYAAIAASTAYGQPDHPSGANGLRAPFATILMDIRKLEGQPVSDTDRAATLSLDDLRRGQLAWRAKLDSLKVRFAYTDRRVLETSFDHLARAQAREGPVVFTETQTIAVKGIKFYREVEVGFLGMLAKTPNAKSRNVIAFNGSESRQLINSQMSAKRAAGVEPLHRMAAMLYGRLAYLPLGPEPTDFEATSGYVPTALSRSDLYKVKPTLEVVDGHPCHVVSSGHDAIWIDPEFGYCVRRRVNVAQTGPDDPGCLSDVHMCQQFKEVFPGVWLPMSGVTRVYTSQRDPVSVRGRVAHVQTVEVFSLEANNVPDSLFEPSFDPGMLVVDHIEKKAYHMPHGEDALDRAIAEGLPIVDGKVVEPLLTARQKLLLVTTGVLFVVLVCLLAKILRRKRAS